MFGFTRKQPTPQPRELLEDTVRLRDLREARGMSAGDYELPSDAEFVDKVLARLERFIAAGATDVETIAMFDQQLGDRQSLDWGALADQRVAHERACETILQVARANQIDAESALERAEAALVTAEMLRATLAQKLLDHDPDFNQFV